MIIVLILFTCHTPVTLVIIIFNDIIKKIVYCGAALTLITTSIVLKNMTSPPHDKNKAIKTIIQHQNSVDT